jgi:hypothetical protein
MKEILKIMPVVLYLIVGTVSMIMAYKNLFAVKFLPFHEKASGKEWNEIDDTLKLVIISLLRLAGLGFLIIALLMLVFPVISYFNQNAFFTYAIPVTVLIFSMSLFIINFSLYSKTKAKTPWKGSLFAMFIIIAGIIISIIC